MSDYRNRVLIVGYGGVGREVVRLLRSREAGIHEKWDVALEVVGVVRRSIVADDLLPADMFYDDVDAALEATDPDIVIELTGTVDPAREIILKALKAGAHVITANKAVLAEHGEELHDASREAGRMLLGEASVGGAIPMLRTLHTSLAGDRITRILGILNGTCNFILTEMEQAGMAFDDALELAKERGYAEPDPTLDINGSDTAHKTTVLAQLAFGVYADYTELQFAGITELRAADLMVARSLQLRPKMVGLVEDRPDGLLIYAGPALLPTTHPVANLHGVLNGIFVEGESVGGVFLSGPGAGPEPTAITVVGDVIEAARRGHEDNGSAGVERWGYRPDELSARTLLPLSDVDFPMYLRFLVPDRPGVLAGIANCLSRYDISIDSMVQPQRHSLEAVPIHLTTYSTQVGAVQAAILEIVQLDFLVQSPLWMPILERDRDYA